MTLDMYIEDFIAKKPFGLQSQCFKAAKGGKMLYFHIFLNIENEENFKQCCCGCCKASHRRQHCPIKNQHKGSR